MLGKILLLSAAAALLGSVSVSPDRYKVATENGEDFYVFEVSGASDEFYDVQLKHWGNYVCPQGYRVVQSKLDAVQRGVHEADKWYNITVACSAQA